MTIEHYPGCTSAYPEKPAGERTRALIVMEGEDGEEIHQCSDCGAFEIVDKNSASDSLKAASD